MIDSASGKKRRYARDQREKAKTSSVMELIAAFLLLPSLTIALPNLISCSPALLLLLPETLQSLSAKRSSAMYSPFAIFAASPAPSTTSGMHSPGRLAAAEMPNAGPCEAKGNCPALKRAEMRLLLCRKGRDAAP